MLAQPSKKAIFIPSLLSSPAWCFLCYAGTSFCTAAQCAGIQELIQLEEKKTQTHVSFGGFYPESVPTIPKPRELNWTNNCQHYLGTPRQGRGR